MNRKLHPVRNGLLAGLVFLLTLFTIVFLLHKLWVALTEPVK